MVTQNLNTNTYVIEIDDSNKTATLKPNDINQNQIILYNASDEAVFVVSGKTAPTAVFPTSATVPLQGKVVAPGATVSFTKNTDHGFISARQAVAGTGSLYISVGAGE